MSDFEDLDFERVNLPDASGYSQVVFPNVKEYYPAEAHVQCHFVMTPGLFPSDKDWIGLFKVGWRNSKDYACYQYVQVAKGGAETTQKYSVLFPGHTLPKDTEEFYQFCFVTENAQVYGASIPFQFKQPSIGDFVEIEDQDDKGMVLIKTRNIAMQEELADKVEQLSISKKEKAELDKKCEAIIKDANEIDFARRNLQIEKDEIEHQLIETQSQVTVLQGKIKELCAQEDANSRMIEEQRRAKDDLHHQLEKFKSVTEANRTLYLKNEETTREIEHLRARSLRDLENVSVELENCKDKLDAAEHRQIIMVQEKTMLQGEVTKLNTELETMRSKNASLQRQVHDMQEQFDFMEERKEAEFKAMEASFLEKSQQVETQLLKMAEYERQMSEMKIQYEKETEGPMHALRLALQSIKKKNTVLVEKNRDLESKTGIDQEALMKENEDLKERLLMGAKEYQKKYIECEKLKRKLRNGSERSSVSKEEISDTVAPEVLINDDASILLPGPATTSEVLVSDEPLTPLPAPIQPNILHRVTKEDEAASSDLPILDPEDEENFQDAPEEPAQRVCPFCAQVFPTDYDDEEFSDHVESHIGPVCPMCQSQFPREHSQEEFERHVQHHFDTAV